MVKLRNLALVFALVAAGCVSSEMSTTPAPSNAYEAAITDSKAMVARCLPLTLSQTRTNESLIAAGFTKRAFGYNSMLRRGVLLTATNNDTAECGLHYPTVWPNRSLVTAAVNSELASQGFRPTGQTGSRYTASNGNISETYYSNGRQQIAVGIAGGSGAVGLIVIMRPIN